MPSATYNTIRQAILAKKNICASYNGYVREMTPHVLGTKGGVEQCLFYQFGGASSSATTFEENSPRNWRCIPLATLKDISTMDGETHNCDQHSQRQTCVDVVDVTVQL